MTTTKGILKYRKVQRTIQAGEDAGKKKFYATAVTDREMSFDEFVGHIASHNSPYSRGVINGVLMDALDCLQELILDGKSVRFSDLGLFSLGMSSKGVDKLADVNAQCIEDVHLIVRNTKNWSNAELKNKCKFQEINSYGVEDITGTTDPSTPSTPSKPSGGNKGGNTGDSSQSGGSSTGGSGSSDGSDTDDSHKGSMD